MPLGGQPISIGRHSQNALPLDDDRASRFHCLIGLGNAGPWVRDLNSSNGTYVNGQRIQSVTLAPGDRVQVGNTRMTLLGPAGAAKPAGDAPVAVHPIQPSEDDPPSLEAIELADEAGGVEELTEMDVVDEEALELADAAPAQSPAWGRAFEDPGAGDAPIPLDDGDVQVPGFDEDPETVLRDLAAALPDRTFGESDVALVSARGQMVHPAGRSAGGADALGLFRRMLLVSTRGRATDIHLEPRDGGYQVRMRVDGTMVDVVRLPTATGVKVAALVKVLSEIDVSQKNIVQEGHFTSAVPSPGGSRRVDYRVSFAPSVFGQKLVMRVLDTTYAPQHVRTLNLPPWMLEEVENALRQDAGMMLVCGPTGSGKTTTLYALVRGSDVQRRNVVTIEDPVEIQLASVTQIPVDEEHGKSFSTLLRSVLRQDPDVILIGEIRDAETARIAMQAAMTGHLVFSTIHTRDTPGTIFRLLDLGVEPYLVAQALHLVLAQRLVRQLCPVCKQAVAPTARQLESMGPAGQGVTRLCRPVGCPHCLGTGYRGRRAFFELLTANDEIRDIIVHEPTIGRIQAALAATPFQRLQHSGYQLVAEGIVAFEEIERAMGRG